MKRDIGTQLGRRERQIVEVLYRLGKASVAEVLAELPDPPSYSAVRGMLALLEDKGHVRHKREGMRYIYTPPVAPARARRSALRQLVSMFLRGRPWGPRLQSLASKNSVSSGRGRGSTAPRMLPKPLIKFGAQQTVALTKIHRKRESANWHWLLGRWFSPARLGFWRQIKPDKLVAAFPCRIDRRNELFRMLFEHSNVVRTKHDKSQLAAFQILLIFETLIRRDHGSKTGVFCCSQQIAVDQPSPA